MKRRHIFVAMFSFLLLCIAAEAQRAGDERGPGRNSAVPRLLKFAGAVRADAGAARTGAASVTFAIYAEQEGGAALWQETQNVGLDAEGRYSVLLGAASREGMPAELFATGEPRWLGVRVNVAGDAEASFEQARVLLVSVPYALRAADAETLGGRAAADFVLREELAGWSGAAAGVPPGPADRPRAVGGAQGVVNATGAVNFMPRVTSINTPLAGDVTYADSQIFDDGTNIRIGNAAVGTGLVNIELTTPSARNAFNSVLRLENATPITGTIVSAMSLTGADRATGNHESFQVARFTLLKNVISTGIATNFDAVFATTSFINQNAPYTVVGWRAEFPRVATGMTLGTYFGLFLEAPLGGGGTVTNAFALVTAPGSGNVGIGTIAPAHLLDVAGNARVSGALRAGQYLDLAGNPIGGSGDITDVIASTGLTGGAASGAATLSFDTTFGDTRYLTLTGGTLTGGISGTTATFTGDVAADNLMMTGALNGGFRVLTAAGIPTILGGSSANSITSGVEGAVVAGGGDPTGFFCGANAGNRVTENFGFVGGGCANQAGDNAGTIVDRAFATVGGGASNTASGYLSTIAGGNTNIASGQESSVGGGRFNTASALQSTVGGGVLNTASGAESTVAGGDSNTAGGPKATVAGGFGNIANGDRSFVGGGAANFATGARATVPGGSNNQAAGDFSFAAGRQAKANHMGSFVWGDSTIADVTSAVPDEFVVRASGGVRFLNVAGNILTISPAGAVTAAAFVGDGSGLTNLPGGGGGDITDVLTAGGSGLMGGATTGAANLTLLTSCAVDEILKWSGTQWACALDNSSTGAGGGPVIFTGSNTASIVQGVQNGPGTLNPDFNNLPSSALRGDVTTLSTTNTAVGVMGTAIGESSIGVLGVNTNPMSGSGVLGISAGSGDGAVVGENVSTTGSTIGVGAIVSSPNGVALRAEALDPLGTVILGRSGPDGGPQTDVFRVSGSGQVMIGGQVTIEGGINSNGGGVKHRRDPLPSLGPGMTFNLAFTWTPAFADANYTVTCSIQNNSGTGLGMRVNRIQSVTATGVTVQIENTDTSAHSGTLHCIAMHD